MPEVVICQTVRKKSDDEMMQFLYSCRLFAGRNLMDYNRSGFIGHGPLETEGIDILKSAQKEILKNEQKDCHIELRG